MGGVGTEGLLVEFVWVERLIQDAGLCNWQIIQRTESLLKSSSLEENCEVLLILEVGSHRDAIRQVWLKIVALVALKNGRQNEKEPLRKLGTSLVMLWCPEERSYISRCRFCSLLLGRSALSTGEQAGMDMQGHCLLNFPSGMDSKRRLHRH